MRVGILGVGGVALGTAAWLRERGVDVALWSPSGRSAPSVGKVSTLKATGAIERAFTAVFAATAADAIDGADVILVALPCYAHAMAFEAMAPHVRNEQIVALSSHASFGALALSRLLASRNIEAPILAWSTTLTAGRRQDDGSVRVSTVRDLVDVAAVPKASGPAELERLSTIFGDRFRVRDGLMAVALSNLNPQNHLAIALGNFTRMELGEAWRQSAHVTPGLGRLIEALDDERLAIARAFDVQVRTVREHLGSSYHLEEAPAGEMFAALAARGGGAMGPASIDTRYVTEDVPFGLAPMVWLGRLVGRRAPLHEAGLRLFSAIYGRDFEAENDLLDLAGVRGLDRAALEALCETGWAGR
jgi:opine dehydrogenase